MRDADGQNPRWTIGSIVQWTQHFFAERQLDTPRLDAELLLAHTLKCSRVHLYTHYDQPLEAHEAALFGKLVRRRAKHEPVAYLLGEREFYGHAFYVTPDVLIPRPETEHVVEVAQARLQGRAAPRILDVGAGSGALAITLALDNDDSEVWGTDISAAALAVAQKNAARHGVEERLNLVQADLFSPTLPKFDLCVANLPYIATGETLPADVADYEPHTALFGGDDGLDIMRAFCTRAHTHLQPGAAVVLEIGHTQNDAVQVLLRAQGFEDVQMMRDLQGHPRVISARWKS